ncbi:MULTISPECIES: GntR family transcriptional regulator [unclassified Arthrobacter]|uniref:GntR family transcriptional regulator n=1 Tax=unclassified Arthrobacter TaxID=235627 RepID=UPI0027D8EB7F|nr:MULTISPECIES: GntR family transcriptional regulator [unclassified Arthrobacter]
MGRAPTRPLIAPVPRQGLGDSVFNSLRTLLEENQLQPGAPLNIDALARELNVSQTPVREALVKLEAAYLVERTASRGFRVSQPLSGMELEKFLKVREMVESLAARWAFEAHGADLAAKLSAAVKEQKEALLAGEGNEPDFFKSDREFHRLIFTHCDNPFLEQISDNLGAQLRRIRQYSSVMARDGVCAVEEHENIARAFADGTAQSVEALMREHLTRVSERAIRSDADAVP